VVEQLIENKVGAELQALRATLGQTTVDSLKEQDVQEMIDEALAAQLEQITIVFREVLTDVPKKRDWQKALEKMASGPSELSQRVSALESGAVETLKEHDVQEMIEESFAGQLEQIKMVFREGFAHVPEMRDRLKALEEMASGISDLSKRVSALESGAANHKEGLRRRIDRVEARTHEMDRRLYLAEEIIERVVEWEMHDQHAAEAEALKGPRGPLKGPRDPLKDPGVL